MASAQLYWGRTGALLLRIMYYLFPMVDWAFVFVDDFCWLLRSTDAPLYTCALVATLLALGAPLSWKKTLLRPIITCAIQPAGPIVQMATEKRNKVLGFSTVSQGDVFTSKDLDSIMGRLQWATSTCPLAKPLLQPLWQWKGAVKSSGRPNQLVQTLPS